MTPKIHLPVNFREFTTTKKTGFAKGEDVYSATPVFEVKRPSFSGFFWLVEGREMVEMQAGKARMFLNEFEVFGGMPFFGSKTKTQTHEFFVGPNFATRGSKKTDVFLVLRFFQGLLSTVSSK